MTTCAEASNVCVDRCGRYRAGRHQLDDAPVFDDEPVAAPSARMASGALIQSLIAVSTARPRRSCKEQAEEQRRGVRGGDRGEKRPASASAYDAVCRELTSEPNLQSWRYATMLGAYCHGGWAEVDHIRAASMRQSGSRHEAVAILIHATRRGLPDGRCRARSCSWRLSLG